MSLVLVVVTVVLGLDTGVVLGSTLLGTVGITGGSGGVVDTPVVVKVLSPELAPLESTR